MPGVKSPRLVETEAQFSRWFQQLAQVGGWRLCHFRPAREARTGAFTTPLTGDRGLPDWIMVHPCGRFMLVELKTKAGVVSPDQQKWLDLLAAAGAEVHVWRPQDRPEIEPILLHPDRPSVL